MALVPFFGVGATASDDVQAHRAIGSTATKSQFEMRRDVLNTTNLTGACSTQDLRTNPIHVRGVRLAPSTDGGSKVNLRKS